MLPVLLAAIILAQPAQQLVSFDSVFPYTEDAPAATTPVESENVVIPEDGVRRTVAAMLRASPTFRRQCARIGRTSALRVVVTRSLMSARLAADALTRITRAADGRVVAEVELGPSGDQVMLLAHEFEHILEQLDGVDLAAMAARSGTGVRRCPYEGFETERAIAVGRQVSAEVSRRGGRAEF
jgi:hypothetical protein